MATNPGSTEKRCICRFHPVRDSWGPYKWKQVVPGSFFGSQFAIRVHYNYFFFLNQGSSCLLAAPLLIQLRVVRCRLTDFPFHCHIFRQKPIPIMLAGSTETCSSLFSGTGCNAFIKVETTVSLLAAGFILAMVVPIMMFFVVDILTCAVTRVMECAKKQQSSKSVYEKLVFDITSTNLIRKYLQNLSTLLLVSRLSRFGIRVDEE